jgi:NADPH-dependent 2,4-dienoyl-CoA reductase/sulfur reductase-like enzyme
MGVDAIDVSSAGYDTFNYWLEPTSFELGWRKYLAEEVKKVVDIPVIAANLIRSPEQAEQQLNDGIQDFVSLGRPHIADPHWANKAQAGRSEDIKRCICCLYCIQSMQDNAYVGDHGYCSVNPAVGREREYNNLPKDGGGRVVVIVGAGMGGLVSAEILAKRGFKPIILEKEQEAGGQINLASKPPKKEKIGWCTLDALHGALKEGAEIHYGVNATPEIIDSYNPYAVIIATGAEAFKPSFVKGADRDNVYTTTDILSGKVVLEGKKVVVVGSGMTGLETAETLVESSNKVTVVEMMGDIAPGVWFQHKDDLMPKLNKKGTEYYTAHKLCSIDDTGVCLIPVEHKKNKNYKKDLKAGKRATPTVAVDCGECTHVDCDAVVLSLGVRSVNGLLKALEGKYDGRVYAIGDAVKSGRIADATDGAYQVASTLK